MAHVVVPATRAAAVAGSFYPADAAALRAALARHFASASSALAGDVPPKLLVVPHAGYVYSGDVAALAYARLSPWRGRIRRVVLLGPAHRVPVRGLALPSTTGFDTPLGRVRVDLDACALLRELPQVVQDDQAHAREHSLEVQLPFLQAVLGDAFTLVPLLVGQASADEVAQVLDRLWGGAETLVVVSSDLSHYRSYASAQAADRATVARIQAFATDLRGEEACGAAPLNGALLMARRHGLAPHLLGLSNSGDVPAGEHSRVVGYGALCFDDPASGRAGRSDDGLAHALLGTAREAIAGALGLQAPAAEGHAALDQPGASFVTLHDAAGRLRGCVGRLEATRPLGEDVRANALAAAFADSRFAPLQASEWPGLQIEVSVLEPAQALDVRSQDEALAVLRPGIDGVVLEWRGTRATLLPQVWEQIAEPAQFLAALKHKAGLPDDFWAPDLRLSRYRVRSFADPVPRAAS